MAYRITTSHLTLSGALQSAMTTAEELRELETEAAEAGRPDIAKAARAELGRRADLTSKAPLFLRVAAAVARAKRESGRGIQ